MGLRVVEQFRNEDSAQFARLIVVGAGVVDDACLGPSFDENHRMPGGALTKLAVEKEIAGQGFVDIAGDEVGVALDQGFGVGELGECAVGDVGCGEGTGADAEEGRAERGFGIMPGADFAGESDDVDAGLLEPGVVVAFEGFAVAVAEEAGAVGDFGRDFGFGSDGLVVGDDGKPAAEGCAVRWVGEAEEVGCSVGKAVGVTLS